MPVEMTPEHQSRLEAEVKWFNDVAEPEHKLYEARWDHQDVLYFGHKRFVESYSDASVNDRRNVLGDGRKEFGAELHIPYVFSTIHTIGPRTLSNRPKMLFTPRDKIAADNVDNVTTVCNAQQHRADYELKLQTTNLSGLKHGIGIQKTWWRFDSTETFALAMGQGGQWVRTPVTRKGWDDPDCGDVDIRDFYWDPFGDSIQSCRRVLHRSWRDCSYILERVAAGKDGWGLYPLEADDLESGGGAEQHRKAWAGRRFAQGLGTGGLSKGADIHEVWEIHDLTRQEVVTVIDRKWVVAIIKNPYWHCELPFQAYRPIEIEHQFVGVSVIDPIEDLQRELDMLRTDRRWNAMLKLHQTYAYNDGVVDPAQIKIGPGRLVPVNGDPRDLLVPLQVGDIPNSGYQEEAALRADIERTTGVDDTVAGNDGGAAMTATGVQLVQAAAGVRIQAYTRRMELELIKPQASQWLALNQQRWATNRDVPIPAMPTPQEPERRWAWRTIGPAELAGEFSVEPEGGSTAPDNVPQDRQDAQMIATIAQQIPGLDPRQVGLLVMKKLGVPSPERLFAPEQTVPPETLDILKQEMVSTVGMDPAGAQAMLENALHAALNAREQAQQGGGGPPEKPVDGQAPAPDQQPQAA
ncbi:head-tail adaptor [Baekduia alba]|uniref:portal protein n=1 Tax=Baekduia alba TaxID=2997333 RepID=UPI002341A554|nr:hypothetical protein [Baekduia alba]WCB94500.1 head-tail adaptor [Baekduia alba]